MPGKGKGEYKPYTCSICGEDGHNSRTHFRYHPPIPKTVSAVKAKPSLMQSSAGPIYEGPTGFRDFVKMIWDALGFDPASRLQLEMADFLQHGPNKIVLLAPRGAAKSHITIAFVLWRLYLDKNVKCVVISKSAAFARKWSSTVLRLIRSVECLKHMAPDKELKQRESVISFEVAGSDPSLHSSVVSFGIEGQSIGSRGNIIVLDDIETPENTRTQRGRDALEQQTLDFRNLIIPNEEYWIFYIGTIHHEDSIYLKLAPRGFTVRKWTIAYPSESLYGQVCHDLAPSIIKDIENNPALMKGGFEGKVGQPVDPERFSAEEIKERIENGWANFLTQSMLTPLMGDNRSPLKIRNFIVLDNLKDGMAPIDIGWTNAPECYIPELDGGGYEGDYFHRYSFISPEYRPFEQVVMALDPSSASGGDDFAWVVVGVLNSRIYVLDAGRLKSLETADLIGLAETCVRHRVTTLWDELNYAGGMFRQVFSPILAEVCQEHDHRCGFHPEGYKRVKSTKNQFIVSVLDNLMSQHRIVLLRGMVQNELAYRAPGLNESRSKERRMFYQLTHIVPDVEDCLNHDDMIDALAMACLYCKDAMGRNQRIQVDRYRQKEVEDAWRDFLDTGVLVDPNGKMPQRKRSSGSWVRALARRGA